MKQLHEKVGGFVPVLDLESTVWSYCMQVNIIPVIAKADTLTPDECAQFKKRVSFYAIQ